MNDLPTSADDTGMTVQIHNDTACTIKKKVLRGVAQEIAEREQVIAEELSVGIVDDDTMQELHEDYYDKEGPTDVLAFPYDRQSVEIILDPYFVKRSAGEQSRSVELLFLEVYVHGILHLCGYDHTSDDNNRHIQRQRELVNDTQNLFDESLIKFPNSEEVSNDS
jgi:probable rRNA maturation factor